MLPKDHDARMRRALVSLEGLSVGDAFGEQFLEEPRRGDDWIAHREAPPPPWAYTDDTTMALSIVRCLKAHGQIQQDALATLFASEYARDATRGYGGTAQKILRNIYKGKPWPLAAGEVFGGEGSCGNGAAMRAAPVGAYFADDIQAVVQQARASAQVTHAHPDGQTGAIAVALAAAWMVRRRTGANQTGTELIQFVLENIPRTETFRRLKLALKLPAAASPSAAARRLGNGSKIIAADTVPFCIWCATHHPENYSDALWSAVSVGGDIDTNCAIIGGIVALSAAHDCIPAEWLQARESCTL